MNSHIVSASALEARLLSSSPETGTPAPVLTQASPIVCDPANGLHTPGCVYAGRRMRLSRGN
jgi:hypothetical protein